MFSRRFKQGKALGSACALFLWCLSELAWARPLGLQTGGVGEGFVFSATNDMEWQSVLSYGHSFGKATMPQAPRDRWNADGTDIKLEHALSYRASPDFLIIGGWDRLWRTHKESFRHHPWTLKVRSPYHRIHAKAVFDRGSWIFGGSIGFTAWDHHHRTLTSKERSWVSEASSFITPLSTLSVGYQYNQITLLSQIAIPHKADYSVDASFPAEEDTEEITYDHEFQEPLRTSLHFLVDFASQFQLAASLEYQNLESSGGEVNQWSTVFDEKGHRKVGGGDVSQDYWQASLGGRYFATADFSVSGALLYQRPSYESTPYFEERHLGGLRASFDVEFVTHSMLRWNLGTSYQAETSHKFVYPHTESHINKHHRIPLESSEKIEISQGFYSFKLGIAYLYDTYGTDDPTDS